MARRITRKPATKKPAARGGKVARVANKVAKPARKAPAMAKPAGRSVGKPARPGKAAGGRTTARPAKAAPPRRAEGRAAAPARRHPTRLAVNVPGCEALYPNYSSCVIARPGRLMFISGQVAVDEKGKVVGKGDVAKQCDYVLNKIRKILEHNGAGLADVVEDKVYVTDRSFHPVVLPVRLKHFPANGPASSFLEVHSLKDPDWLIEISVIAVLPD